MSFHPHLQKGGEPKCVPHVKLSAEKSSVKLRPRFSGQILGVQSLQLSQFLSDPEIFYPP